MNIKNKLIHLLGGFTKDDMPYINPENKIHHYTSHVQQQVRTLKAAYCISDLWHQPPDDFLQRELMAKLANTIMEEKLVTFYTKQRYPGESEYPQDVYATIRVVEPMEEGEAYEMPI